MQFKLKITAHIEALCLTYLAENTTLIEEGKVFLAYPPLYKIIEGKKNIFIKDEDAYQEFLINKIKEKRKDLKLNDIRLFISYKNLMDIYSSSLAIPEQLFEEMLFSEDIETESDIAARLSTPELNISYDDKIKEFTISGLYVNTFVEGRIPLEYYNNLGNVLSNVINGTSIYTEVYYTFIKELVDSVTPKYRNRLKGLGEMNAKDLYASTMDPETRTLIQVHYDDKEADIKNLDIYFNKKPEFVEQRKQILLESRVKLDA